MEHVPGKILFIEKYVFSEKYFMMYEQVYKRKEHIGKFKNNILSNGTSSKQTLGSQLEHVCDFHEQYSII